MTELRRTTSHASGSSAASSYSLRSLDSESVADEVQQLNTDVMDALILEDDMIAGDAIKKSLTHREEDAEEPLPPPPPQRRRSTIVDSIKRTATFQKISKIGFWDSEFKRQRIKVYSTFLTNYLILSVVLALILCIMWGTYFHRERRYHNMKIIVVNDDLSVDGNTPVIGNTVVSTAGLPQVKASGGWEVYSHEEFAAQAAKHNNTYREELDRLVHHQEYWGAMYVHPNATSQLYNAIVSNDTSFNVTGTMVEVIYETGRDFLAVGSYVTNFFQVFEAAFMQMIKEEYSTLISELPSTEDRFTAISFISHPTTFLYTDNRPTDSILMAPLQLGLTYLVVFTFFQLLLTIRVQMFLASVVKGPKYLLVRMLVSQLSYVILAGAYVVLNMAFQISVTKTFGDGGGFVLWSFGYLTIASLGSLNEFMAVFLFTYYPPLIGGWLVLLIALNVAPTTSPMALISPFYRYGYAMPIHNSYELAKVVFCDTYKGQMGRNIGILVAWIVVTNAALPFMLLHASKVRERRERQAKEKAEQKDASDDN